MDIEITKLLVPAITGLFAGTIGSLIAPWVNWRIEKHRKSIEYKQDLIKDARKLVDNADSLEAILSSSLWGFISSHLTKEERYSVSSGNHLHQPSIQGMDELAMRKQKISHMLHRLESEWHF
ncbi:hypothetical protein BZA03_1224 [Alteromonas sp. I10]|jgi:hypothetical protein|uniref:hypothetical protein n=1 Tax=Alteromonas TaxID=226 RepID=UPI000D75948D|nr:MULTISPECIES: hypothetical protein [Alteromonas]PXW67861.1 hypothetical protein BZA03_1224 [Alteromonas sp. I10]